MKRLFVDPGSVSGYACYNNGNLCEHGYCNCKVYDKECVDYVKSIIELTKPEEVYIERQFLPEPKKENGKVTGRTLGIFTLVLNRSVWDVLSTLIIGSDAVKEVNVAKWQSHFGLKVDKSIKSKYSRKKKLKQDMICKVKELFGIEVCENEADAVLIGKYITDKESSDVTGPDSTNSGKGS
ncbi:MAG: hypothetical protein WC444_05320 [Candidatus Paceibacterota bacterium]